MDGWRKREEWKTHSSVFALVSCWTCRSSNELKKPTVSSWKKFSAVWVLILSFQSCLNYSMYWKEDPHTQVNQLWSKSLISSTAHTYLSLSPAVHNCWQLISIWHAGTNHKRAAVIDQTGSWTVSALETPEHACNNLWAVQQQEGDVQAGLHFKDICLPFFPLLILLSPVCHLCSKLANSRWIRLQNKGIKIIMFLQLLK